ncbi:MAG TPA: type II toxin-antitoxin system RelE/ParE family toxin [Gemmataceae bacterium]|nr:type II toxin-antitoxin system RelE/ParE family toxin [Gemmataceae bacterium]
MAQVLWTERATRDLREIVDYVAQQAPARAAGLVDRLTAAVEPLHSSPRLGRVVPDFGEDHIRELVSVRPYRIVYMIRDDDCYITHIIHGRRNFADWVRRADFDDI